MGEWGQQTLTLFDAREGYNKCANKLKVIDGRRQRVRKNVPGVKIKKKKIEKKRKKMVDVVLVCLFLVWYVF